MPQEPPKVSEVKRLLEFYFGHNLLEERHAPKGALYIPMEPGEEVNAALHNNMGTFLRAEQHADPRLAALHAHHLFDDTPQSRAALALATQRLQAVTVTDHLLDRLHDTHPAETLRVVHAAKDPGLGIVDRTALIGRYTNILLNESMDPDGSKDGAARFADALESALPAFKAARARYDHAWEAFLDSEAGAEYRHSQAAHRAAMHALESPAAPLDPAARDALETRLSPPVSGRRVSTRLSRKMPPGTAFATPIWRR